MSKIPQYVNVFFKICIILIALEVSLEAEYYFLKPRYKQFLSNKSFRVLILGDCVSMRYPQYLQNYLAQKNIQISLFDNIIYHNISLNLASENKEIIKQIKPNLIISMIGLFENSKRNLQYGITTPLKSYHFPFKLRILSLLDTFYYDYFTSEGQVKRIGQDYLSSKSPDKFNKLQDYLFSHMNSIEDNYSRAFILWSANLQKNNDTFKKYKINYIKGYSLLNNATTNQEDKIVQLSNHFDEVKFRKLKSNLITMYLLSGGAYLRDWNPANPNKQTGLKYFEKVLGKNDPHGFKLIEAILLFNIISRPPSTIDSRIIDLIEMAFMDLAQKDSLLINQMADKACSLIKYPSRSKVQCRLNVYDMFIYSAEAFEILKNSKLNPKQKIIYNDLKELYSSALPEFDFTNDKKMNIDHMATSFIETQKYYDSLIKVVISEHVPIIIAQYPTFKLPFLDQYGLKNKDVYIFDTPEILKSSEVESDFLISNNPSIYNRGKLNILGLKYMAQALGDFIIKNNILNK